MITVILSHEVKDYSIWKKEFDIEAPNRLRMSVSLWGVYQAIDNPNQVTVITEIPSVEAFKAFMATPDLKTAMEKGGVIGMPDVKILSKIWFRSLCLKVGLI